MSETGPTKVCSLCAETIQAAAKICPRCRYSQRKWSLFNPAGMALWFVVGSTALIAGAMYLDKVLRSNEQFAIHRDEISVVSSQFTHRMSGSNLMISVVGMLTNRSGIAWKDVGVEAQFFDNSGRLIDVISVNADYSSAHVPILPHGETAFKVEGKAVRPESDYDNYKAIVRWAKDSDAW
jgi:hypothetical protein